MKSLICTTAASLWLSAGFAAAETLFIENALLHPGGGKAAQANVDILIEDDRIAAVGVDLTAPAGAQVIEAEGMTATPGLFAAYSQLGLVEVSFSADANDAAVAGQFPLSAAFDVQYAVNEDSTAIPVARAGGVTRAFTAPSVVTGVFGGQAALIHLAESGDSLMKAQAAVVAAVGHLGASRSGESRAAAWTVLRETLDDARTYDRNRRMFSISRERDQRAPLTDIKALVPVVKGDQTLALMADGAGDLRQAIRLKRDYGLDLVVIGGSEAWRVADALAEAEIPVVLTPTENLPSHFDALGATLQNAAALEEAGVLFAFIDDGISRAHFLTSLPQMAGNAAANGLSHAAALAAITSSPAEIWGLGDDLGVVEKGKLADLVLWSGDPLEVTSRVRKVFIAGEEQPLRTRQHQLRDRYADLERGDLPFAYRGGSLDAATGGDAAAAPAVEDAPETPVETPV
ncbi:MAG: amidohydrolase family protein, partial [Pseudomonadota bacterium]